MADIPNVEKKESKSTFQTVKDYFGVISIIVTISTAIFAAYLNSKTSVLTHKTTTLEENFKKNADNRAEIDLQAKYNLAAYEAVTKVIDARQDSQSAKIIEQKESAVISLINATAREPLKSSLLNIITKYANSEGAKETAKASADVYRTVGPEVKNVPIPPPSWVQNNRVPSESTTYKSLEGFRIDVFNCEQSYNETKDEKIAALIVKELEAHKLETRPRKLLSITNSSPGYNIKSNQIRYEVNGEVDASYALRSILQQTKIEEEKVLKFDLVQVSNKTSKYLSVFVCNN